MLTTIGRKSGVAQIYGLGFAGFVAWILWLVVHIFWLIGFRNRVVVLFEWAWAYFSYQRGARVMVAPPLERPSGTLLDGEGTPRGRGKDSGW